MTHPVSIRLALLAERAPLEALQWRASLANPGDHESLLANPDAISLPAGQIASALIFVAERKGVIVGFAAMRARDDAERELDGLFVEPQHWTQGIGRTLVDHCIAEARASGCSVLNVVANPQAAGFYKACGFKHAGHQATRFGPGLLMRKKL